MNIKASRNNHGSCSTITANQQNQSRNFRDHWEHIWDHWQIFGVYIFKNLCRIRRTSYMFRTTFSEELNFWLTLSFYAQDNNVQFHSISDYSIPYKGTIDYLEWLIFFPLYLQQKYTSTSKIWISNVLVLTI